MPIAFRSGESATTIDKLQTTITALKPSGVVSGDVLVGCFAFSPGGSVTGSVTPPAGWTSIVGITDLGSPGSRVEFFYKVAGAAEPVDYTFSFSPAAGAALGISAYSGVDNTTPVVSGETASNVVGTSTASHSISVTVAGPRWVIAGFAQRSGATWTPVTGTERHQLIRTGETSFEVLDSNGDVSGSASLSATASTASSVGAHVGFALQPGAAPTTFDATVNAADVSFSVSGSAPTVIGEAGISGGGPGTLSLVAPVPSIGVASDVTITVPPITLSFSTPIPVATATTVADTLVNALLAPMRLKTFAPAVLGNGAPPPSSGSGSNMDAEYEFLDANIVPEGTRSDLRRLYWSQRLGSNIGTNVDIEFAYLSNLLGITGSINDLRSKKKYWEA